MVLLIDQQLQVGAPYKTITRLAVSSRHKACLCVFNFKHQPYSWLMGGPHRSASLRHAWVRPADPDHHAHTSQSPAYSGPMVGIGVPSGRPRYLRLYVLFASSCFSIFLVCRSACSDSVTAPVKLWPAKGGLREKSFKLFNCSPFKLSFDVACVVLRVVMLL